MAKLEYSQIVRRKLKALQSELVREYGQEKAQLVMRKIINGINILEVFPQSGTKIPLKYDIACDYSYIFVEHNYFFYRMLNENIVLVLEMFHEKDDFMRKLFGIITTSRETIDYWGE